MFVTLWIGLAMFGYQAIKPLMPFCVLLHLLAIFLQLYIPLTAYANGSRNLDWIDLPIIGLYALMAFMIAGYTYYKKRSWICSIGYLLLVAIAAVIRFLHSKYIFFEYVKSESDKILVILLYQPLCSVILLSFTRVITLRMIQASPERPPESCHWYTVYAGFHLAIQVTGRYGVMQF